MTWTSASGLAEPASVFSEFPARAYLEKYYNAVGSENTAFLRSITDYLSARDVSADRVIEIAGGPSLFSMFTLAALRGSSFRQVTFTDIAWRNLGEVDAWLRDDPRQFDYEPLVQWLQEEVGADPSTVVESMRDSPWELAQFDWRCEVPTAWLRAYDVVCSHFFAESATDDEDELVSMLEKVGRVGRPGATVLLSFMCRSNGYKIGHQDFPAFDVDEANVWQYLARAGVNLGDAVLRTAPTEDPYAHPGYDGMLFIGGRLEG
jgi:NNMT/PNMT/TEMT family protein